MNFFLRGQIFHLGPHVIESLHADNANGVANKFGAIAVLTHFGVQAHQITDELFNHTAVLAAAVEALANGANCGDNTLVNTVHDHVGVPFQQAHDRG